MKGVVAFAGACAVALGLAADVGRAQDGMGLAGIHEWVRIGRKTCMVDHFHDGVGNGPTKSQAQAAAIRAWADFTAWEYGSRWAKWQLSVSKSSNCSGKPGSFSCSVSSRPCAG